MPKRALLIAGLCLFMAAPAYAGGGGKLPFNKDVGKAQLEAEMLGRAQVLYFTADW